MIHNNIDGIGQTFQIMLSNLESFKDGKQFLVIYIIIQLCCSESVGVKSNWRIAATAWSKASVSMMSCALEI